MPLTRRLVSFWHNRPVDAALEQRFPYCSPVRDTMLALGAASAASLLLYPIFLPKNFLAAMPHRTMTVDYAARLESLRRAHERDEIVRSLQAMHKEKRTE
jgi:hypothetical protein